MSDSDVDDEILHGLGLGSKRPRRAGASDSEPDDDEEEDYAPGPPTARPVQRSRAAVAGKKKRRKADEDEEISGDDEEEEDDGYGSDLYYDEEDRAKLMNMTQLEREMVLAERAEQLIDRKERRNLLGKKSKQQTELVRGSSRGKQPDAKRDAMDKLKAARERKAQQTKAKQKQNEEEDEDYAISDEEVSDVSGAGLDEYAEERNRRPSGADQAVDRRAMYDDIPEAEEEHDDASYEEVKAMQVRRHKLEQWVNEPFFERCVQGCIVRLSVGSKDPTTGQPVSLYLMAVVDSVFEREPGKYRDMPNGRSWTSPYPFGPNGAKTGKWIQARRGSSVKPFPLCLVSNSSVTEDEYTSWTKQCTRDQHPLLSRHQAEQAAAQLMEAHNYVYSAKDIQEMLQAKRSKGLVVGSVTQERARLTRLRDAAYEEGRHQEAELMDVQLLQLDSKYRQQAHTANKVAISEINRKNTAINFQNMLQNVSNRPEGARLAEDETNDVFSRRKTRPVVYFAPAQHIKAQGEQQEAAPAPQRQATPSNAKKQREAAQASDRDGAQELGIDLGLLELHGKVPSVALELLGRGWKDTLSHVGKGGTQGRPGKVLTLNDYKRRQGIA